MTERKGLARHIVRRVNMHTDFDEQVGVVEAELSDLVAERDALKVERDELRKAISPALYACPVSAHHFAWCALAKAHASDSESMDRFDELEAQLAAGDAARAALREALEALVSRWHNAEPDDYFIMAHCADELAKVLEP